MILPPKSQLKPKGNLSDAIAPAIARLFLSSLFLAPFLIGCAAKTYEKPDLAAGKTPEKRAEITFVAAGDNLIHKQLINNAKISGKNEYDFKPFYSEIKDVIKGADIAFINQETLIAGERFGYSGYPVFNAPSEVGDALIDAGFNVINHASNHAMDRGKDGVLAVADYWRERDKIFVLGIHATKEDREKSKIMKIGGANIGFLAYTYGLNGFALPKGMPFLVSLIDVKAMEKDIAAIKKECDFLIVSMHWGEEYKYVPAQTQEKLSKFLADLGVNLVIGHHPHVLQSVKWVESKDGNKTLVYYSLGNFISAQNKAPRTLGGLARLTIVKEGAKIFIENPKLLPLITHYNAGFTGFKTYLLSAYPEEKLKTHGLYEKDGDFTLPRLKSLYGSIVSEEFR